MTASGQPESTLPGGKVLPETHPPRFRGNVAALRSMYRRNGLDIVPGTPVPMWNGEKMDLGLEVIGLVQYD